MRPRVGTKGFLFLPSNHYSWMGKELLEWTPQQSMGVPSWRVGRHGVRLLNGQNAQFWGLPVGCPVSEPSSLAGEGNNGQCLGGMAWALKSGLCPVSAPPVESHQSQECPWGSLLTIFMGAYSKGPFS